MSYKYLDKSFSTKSMCDALGVPWDNEYILIDKDELLDETVDMYDEDGKNMRAPFYNKKHTKDGRKKCGLGKREGKEHWNWGGKASEETREKMSKTRTGKKRGPHTEEGKRNISNGKKGKSPDWSNVTDAERKARSERAKAQWASGNIGRKKKDK